MLKTSDFEPLLFADPQIKNYQQIWHFVYPLELLAYPRVRTAALDLQVSFFDHVKTFVCIYDKSTLIIPLLSLSCSFYVFFHKIATLLLQT